MARRNPVAPICSMIARMKNAICRNVPMIPSPINIGIETFITILLKVDGISVKYSQLKYGKRIVDVTVESAIFIYVNKPKITARKPNSSGKNKYNTITLIMKMIKYAIQESFSFTLILLMM